MSVKRSSTTDTIYPLKKRALLEHRKLHETENIGNDLEGGVNQDTTGCYGNGVTGAGDLMQISNSGIIDTCLPVSMETSPTAEQSPPDYQTPERVPLSLRNNYKLISKPLFPSNDRENIQTNKIGSTEDTSEINTKQIEFDIHYHDIDKSICSAQLYQNIPYSVINTGTKYLDSDIGPRPEIVRNNLTYHSELKTEKSAIPFDKQNEIQRNNICDNIKPNQNKVTVQKCEVTVQNALKISNFTNTVESIDKTECKVCGLKFATQSQLIHHAKQHREIIRCWKCREEFPSAERLNFHMKLEHKGENPYKCETCSREFTQYNNLRRHQRVHRENMYKCKLCDREFNEEFYLKMHMGTHTGNRVYSCGVCRAEFPSNHDLKMHVKTHSPSLLHTCVVCGKSFSKACVLRQHKKCHSGQRPHKCAVCEKTFIHRHHLTMHMKSHTEEERKTADLQKVESLANESKNLIEDKKELESDSNSSKEISYEDIHSENIPAEKSYKKSRVTCNKNLSDKFFNIPQNADETKSGKLEKRCRRNSSLSHLSGHSPFSSCEHVQPSLQKSGPANFGYTPNTSYPVPYHPLPNMSLAQNQMHPGFVRPMFPSSAHSYGDLYQQYTEQVQAYMNNMFMMNFLSQNANLQNFQGQGYTGLQSEGHKLSQSHRQLSAVNDTLVPDQHRMTGEGHITSQVKCQQSSDRVQPIRSQGQVDPSLYVILDKMQNVVNAAKNAVPDVNLSEPTSEDPSAANLEVISGDEEVSVVNCVDDETKKACDPNQVSSNVNVVSNKDEQEIAEEMIKMSTGLNCRTEDVDDKLQVANKCEENKTVDNVKATEKLNFDAYLSGVIEDTLKQGSKPDSSDKHKLHVKYEELRSETDSKSDDHCQSQILTEVPKNNLQELSDIQDSSEKLERKDDNINTDINLHYQQTSVQNPKSLVGTERRHIFEADDRLSICTSEPNGYTSPTNTVTYDQQTSWQPSQYHYILSQISDSNNSEPALEEKFEEAEVYEMNIDVRDHLPQMKKHDKTRKDIFEELERDSGEESDRNGLYHNESNRKVRTECETEDKDKFDKFSVNELVSNTENGSCKKENNEKNGSTSKFHHKLNIDDEEKIDKFYDIDNSLHSSLEEKKLEIDEDIDGNDSTSKILENKPSEKVKIDNSLWSSLECVGRANIVNTVNEANAHKVNDNTHSSFELNHFNVNESQAIDLRTKLRNDEGVKPVIRSVSVDENKCVMYELNSQKKLKSPRDLYVIKRSDILNSRSHNIEDPTTQYCPDSRQSYFMERSDFLNHMDAHETDKKTENKTKHERKGKDQKDSRKNSKSSPKRSVLKQIDLNSPTKKRKHSRQPMLTNGNAKESPMLHKCEICSRCFAQKHNLNRHKICHNSKQHECNICGRSFKEQFYLQMHMKVHISEIKRQCEVCGQNVLKSDFVEHTNEHFHYIAENPTYSQIGDRVREILHVQKSSREIMKGDSVLYEQITKFPNMKGSLDELAELMKLTKSGHLTGIVPLNKM